jgi:hypothetical protein
MELGYEKLMRENNLKLSDLNEDARNGIANVKAVMVVVNREAKKGKSVSDLTWSKVRTNDKWICGEILETLDGKERNNTDELPYDEEEIIDQIQDEQEEQNNEIDQMESTDPIGIKIDTELDIAYMNGNTRISLEDLKNVSHTAYNVIFDNYESNTKNGVETTYFNLLETDKYIFTLTKK